MATVWRTGQLLGRRSPGSLRRFAALVGAGLAVAVLAAALAGLPLVFAAALVAGLVVLVLIIVEPAFGLYAAVLSVPVQELVVLPAGLTVTQVVVVLAFGAWLLRVLARPERAIRLYLLAPWLVFLAVQLLGIALTPYSRIEGVLQFARWIASFLAFVLALGTITDRTRARGLVAALLLGPAFAAALGVLQFAAPSLAPESFLIVGGDFARASGTFGKPNSYAGYLNMAWPLALALAGYWGLRAANQANQANQANRPEHRRKNTEQLAGNLKLESWNLKLSRAEASSAPTRTTAWSESSQPATRNSQLDALLLALASGGIAAILLAGLFASYSRGGWIGAVCGLGALALLAGRRTAITAGFATLALMLVGLIGAFSLLPEALTERLSTITNNLRIFDAGEIAITPENFAIVERMAHWQAGWRMFEASPLTGIGAGNFNTAYRDYFVAPWSISQGHAHNYYIHTLAESGVLGLAAYGLLIGAMALEALRARRELRGTAWGAAALGVCGIIAAVAGHNVFENLHVLNMGIQLSSVWALPIVARRWRR